MEEIKISKAFPKEEKEQIEGKIKKAAGECHCHNIKINFGGCFTSILVENHKTKDLRAKLKEKGII
ncbi:MAG: hypothetical protein PHE77_00040 [Candidatus Pacebacteria bacterium]|nr:hypothetical protein [Candidatus Paceibacterota bacterium]